MDVFGGGWTGYVEKLAEGLGRLEPEDTIVLCGDISWGMSLEQAKEDFAFLDKLPGVLKSGGRVAVLTFHSGEDRLVKKAFKQGLKDGIFSEIAEDVIRPSAGECFRNPRAKSTKMRWAVKA